MNAMSKLERQELEIARFRALQAIYAEAHAALVNWGKWSRDERGIRPVEARTSIYDQIKEDDRAGWADEDDAQKPVYRITVRVKADRPEEESYDLKSAELLDIRMHAPGGLSETVRHVLRVAYVWRDIPEHQFPNRCSCGWDGVVERMEEALRFVGRWI